MKQWGNLLQGILLLLCSQSHVFWLIFGSIFLASEASDSLLFMTQFLKNSNSCCLLISVPYQVLMHLFTWSVKKAPTNKPYEGTEVVYVRMVLTVGPFWVCVGGLLRGFEVIWSLHIILAQVCFKFSNEVRKQTFWNGEIQYFKDSIFSQIVVNNLI